MMRSGTGLVTAALFAAAISGPASAVTILDSTYAAEGYKAAEALAAQPQFAASVALCEGAYCGNGSGTWIGNDDEGHGYILSAAHVFVGQGYDAGSVTYRASDGTMYEGESVAIHPFYKPSQGDDFKRMGWDFAIVKLTRPVEGVGEAPTLFFHDRYDERLTFVGFGARGTGTTGADESIEHGDKAAAADGVVARAYTERDPVAEADADTMNFAQVVFFKEDGSVECPDGYHCPDTKAATRTEGAIGAGDSGGGVWTTFDDGSGAKWYLAGVNAVGLGEGKYGDLSMLAMVVGAKPWIEAQFPGAKFFDPYKE